MKEFICTVFLVLSSIQGVLSQDWQSYPISSVSSAFWWTGELPLNQQFKINEYDSSMWFLQGSTVMTINKNGEIWNFNASSTSVFNEFLNIQDIAFTTEATFILDRDQGLYKYKNLLWSKISSLTDGVHLSSDLDTILCSRVNQPYIKIEPLSFSFGLSNIRRAESKNGIFWGINAINNGFLRKYLNDGSFIYYNADTIDFLLDNKHYHMKFSKNSGLFYTSGDKGFSIANEDDFIDTITPLNTVGMPDLPILEFEFDVNDNIWAVFGTYIVSGLPQKIGFFNRALNEWTDIYDASNSPIDFSIGISIEIDAFGNVWVVNGPNLHVLRMSTEPGWLALQAIIEQDQLIIFPNPGKDEVMIEFTDNFNPITIEMTDLSGKRIFQTSISNQKNFPIDVKPLKSGVYLLKFENNQGQIVTERWVKQ